MANARKTVDFTDIEPVLRATFIADGTTVLVPASTANAEAQKGLAVNLSTHKTVQLAGDAEAVLGAIDHVEPDGMVVVHLGPVVEYKGGTGATLTPGSAIVGALLSSAKGYIRSVAPATLAEVAVAKGAILDSS